MPRKVHEDEVVAGTKPSKKALAFHASLEELATCENPDDTRLRALFGWEHLMEGSENFTTEPVYEQQMRIKNKKLFADYMRDVYPKLVRIGKLRPSTAPEDDPWNFDDVDNLIYRIKSYLSYYATTAEGESQNSKITDSTLRSVAENVVLVLDHHIKKKVSEAGMSLDESTKVLNNVMRRDITGETGAVHQIHKHARWLISEQKLPFPVIDNTFFGREETKLLLDDMRRFYFSGIKDCEDIIQRMLLVQLAFIHGLRLETMTASAPDDDHELGMACKDVVITQKDRGIYTLHLTIHLRKMLKGPITYYDRREINPMMPPVKNAEHLVFEPTISVIVLLIHRGKLKEDGKNGNHITTVDQFLQSRVWRFVGVGDEPLLRQKREGEYARLTAQDAIGGLKFHTDRLGLPSGGFDAFRRDFAAAVSISFGQDKARLLLDDLPQNDVLHKCYTGGIKDYNLLGFRTGDIASKSVTEKMRVSNYNEERATNLARQNIQNLAQEDKPGSALSNATKKRSIAQEEIDEYCKDKRKRQHNEEIDTSALLFVDQMSKVDELLTNKQRALSAGELSKTGPGVDACVADRIAWMQLYYAAWDGPILVQTPDGITTTTTHTTFLALSPDMDL